MALPSTARYKIHFEADHLVRYLHNYAASGTSKRMPMSDTQHSGVTSWNIPSKPESQQYHELVSMGGHTGTEVCTSRGTTSFVDPSVIAPRSKRCLTKYALLIRVRWRNRGAIAYSFAATI